MTPVVVIAWVEEKDAFAHGREIGRVVVDVARSLSVVARSTWLRTRRACYVRGFEQTTESTKSTVNPYQPTGITASGSCGCMNALR